MRAILIAILSVLLLNPVFAEGVAKLRLNVSSVKNPNVFVCVDRGCYSIAAAAAGKTYKIEPQAVESLMLADTNNARLYAQSLPNSCQVTVNNDKTLVISGQVINQNSGISLAHVRCKVM